MRVTNDALRHMLQAYLDPVNRKSVREDKGQAGVKAQEGDTVVISDRARELSKMRAMLDKLPDVRQERVVYLKKLIESGTYNVDGRMIVDKLLRFGSGE